VGRRTWNVNRLAIAGAIAWEALEHVNTINIPPGAQERSNIGLPLYKRLNKQDIFKKQDILLDILRQLQKDNR
jgi:hypothetical protein